MRFKISRLIAMFFVVGVLVMASVPALLAAGSGPGDATRPAEQWAPIAGKTSQWYVFRDEGDNTPISVRMQAGNGVSFAVYTPANLSTPVGRGTSNANLGNDLFWTGNFNRSGNYYVVVRNSRTEASGFHLAITGSKVSFPTQNKATVAVTSAPAASVVASMPTTTQGSNNFAIDGKVRTLNAGETHIYPFRYNGKGGQILVNLVDEPFGTATVQVWTPAEWAAHAQPIGVGSSDKYVGRDSLVWSGNFNSAGTYYVVVKHAGPAAQAASYVLHVSGSGVAY